MPLNDEDIAIFSKILSNYYKLKVKEINIPRKTKTISEEKLVNEPYIKKKIVDKGPHIIGYITFIIGNALTVAIAIIINMYLGICFLLFSNTMGFVIIKKIRKKKVLNIKKTRRVKKIIKKDIEISSSKVIHKTIPNNIKVNYLGRGSIPFSVIKTSFGNLVEGPNNLMHPMVLEYPILNKIDKLYNADNFINKKIQKIPWILQGKKTWFNTKERTDYGNKAPLYDLEKQIRKYFKLVKEIYSHVKTISIEFNVIKEPRLLSILIPASNDKITKTHTLENLIKQLDSKGGNRLDAFSKKWIINWSRINAVLFEARKESLCDKLAPECFELGNIINYSAFNFYCPVCNKNNQQTLLNRDYSVQDNNIYDPIFFSRNTQCIYNPKDDVWKCKTCENETKNPIPLHKMLDEIFFPVYDHLMDENKIERIRTHKNVREKEICNINEMEKEIDKVQYNYISHLYKLSDEMERFKADIDGESLAISSMQEILDEYEIRQNRVIRNVQSFSADIEKEIKKRTEYVLHKVDEVKNKEMQTLDKELNYLSRAKRIEDERRDEIQRSILLSNIQRNELLNEQISTTRNGLNRVTSAVKESTHATTQGFQNVTSAVNKNTVTMNQGFSSVSNAVNRNTDISKKGLDNISRTVSQGNAIHAAMAKKQNVNLYDENPILHPLQSIKRLSHDIMGSVIGRRTIDTERKKLSLN